MKIRDCVDGSIVGMGEITGMPRVDTFHSVVIEPTFVRILVSEVTIERATLPCPNDDEEHKFLKDVKGLNTLWRSKFLRKC